MDPRAVPSSVSPPPPTRGEERAAPPLPAALVRDLVAVVGAGAVVTDPDRLLVYESDGLVHHRGRPAAVVLPGDTEEGAEVVSLLDAHGVTVVPRGAGTGLSGGAVPSPGSVVVGTARMNRILELDPARRRARLQAGAINADLSRAARPHGLHYAPDPSSQTACTIGGNVAENSGGPHCLKYGVTSRYVTGLTVVTPRGEVVLLDADDPGEAGLVGLMVGSEGCFGLVTEVEVRLVPPAPAVRTLLAAFPTLESAGAAVSSLVAGGALPAALEILDHHTIRAVEESVFAAGYPRDAGAVLVAEFDGPEAVLDLDAGAARHTFLAHGATEIREARSETERAALWKGRKKAFGAMGRLAPDLLVQDATVPRSRLPAVLAGIEEVAERHRLRVANVFHAGDGNLHPNLVFDRRDPDQLARVEAASREIMELCVAAGGTITGEHGVGVDKRAYMHLVHTPAELDLQRAVRRVFDPRERWNPGKVLPDPEVPREPPPPPVPSTAAGGRTGPSQGGASPGVVSSGVVRYEPADLVITVSADLAVTALQRVVAEAGQWLPVAAAGLAQLTVGDLVDQAGESTLAASHGSVRDLVLGCRLRRPGAAGEVRLGGEVVKNVAGFNLLAAVVGRRGRLGTLTEVTVRLWPLPETDRTVRIAAPDAAALAPHAEAVAALALPPDAVELVWGRDGAELSVRAVGSRARVEAVLAGVERALAGSGLPVRSVDGAESRIPVLPHRTGHSRRPGLVGRVRDAIEGAPGGDGVLQVDQGLLFTVGDLSGPPGDAPGPVARWWEGVEAAFGSTAGGTA